MACALWGCGVCVCVCVWSETARCSSWDAVLRGMDVYGGGSEVFWTLNPQPPVPGEDQGEVIYPTTTPSTTSTNGYRWPFLGPGIHLKQPANQQRDPWRPAVEMRLENDGNGLRDAGGRAARHNMPASTIRDDLLLSLPPLSMDG